MNIAYCCLLLPKEKVSAERAKKHLPGVSLHKLSKSIIAGLDENSEKNVTVFSIINTLNYPNYPKLFFESEKWSHSRESKDMYLGYINLFGVKYLTQTHSVYKNLKKWVNQAPDNEENVICVHHIYYPLMKAAIKIKRKYKKKVHVCLITGDMVGKYGLKSQSRDNIKQKLLLHVEKSIEKMVGEFDSFVFATKYMASAFGVDDKPYTVLECMYTLPSESEVENEPKETNNKIIFYAGALRHEYGIDHLLRAFSMIQDQNYKLWLAGGGNAEEEIKKYMKNDDRISFLGFI